MHSWTKNGTITAQQDNFLTVYICSFEEAVEEDVKY